jgi:23S rRNA pseudouridine955/2504/2580 synthase
MNWIVAEAENIVACLKRKIGEQHSGKLLRKMLETGVCRLNGRVERFGSARVRKGDRVELLAGWEKASKKENKAFTVLYEDKECRVVNKPAGWVCSPENCRKSFGEWVLVHRLDKETTGALLLAKSPEIKEELIELFEKKAVEKEYLAIVDGRMRGQGVRKSLFGKKRSYDGQTIWGSGATGLEAITKWKVLKTGKEASLVQCEPVTGRTHQIRVHLAEMRFPILVDRQYAEHFQAKFFAKRPLLHAHKLRFTFRGKKIAAEAPIAEDFSEAMQVLGLTI